MQVVGISRCILSRLRSFYILLALIFCGCDRGADWNGPEMKVLRHFISPGAANVKWGIDKPSGVPYITYVVNVPFPAWDVWRFMDRKMRETEFMPYVEPFNPCMGSMKWNETDNGKGGRDIWSDGLAHDSRRQKALRIMLAYRMQDGISGERRRPIVPSADSLAITLMLQNFYVFPPPEVEAALVPWGLMTLLPAGWYEGKPEVRSTRQYGKVVLKRAGPFRSAVRPKLEIYATHLMKRSLEKVALDYIASQHLTITRRFGRARKGEWFSFRCDHKDGRISERRLLGFLSDAKGLFLYRVDGCVDSSLPESYDGEITSVFGGMGVFPPSEQASAPGWCDQYEGTKYALPKDLHRHPPVPEWERGQGRH